MVRGRTGTFLIVLVLLTVTASAGMGRSSPSVPHPAALPLATPQARPPSTSSPLYEAVSPAYRSEVVATTEHRLSRYMIMAALHPPGSLPIGSPQATLWASPVATPEASPGATPASVADATLALPAEQMATITGLLELRYVNETGAPMTELYFRLYPNLRQYGSGSMVVRDLMVDGLSVAPEPPPLYSVPGATPVVSPDAGSGDLILLRLPLAKPLPPESTTTVRMAFTTTVPVEPPDETGLFRFIPETGAWTLAHWFPILAGYDPALGWQIGPPASWSDPTFANTALFDVTLTAPPDLVLVTTGVAVQEELLGEHRVQRFVSGPVRDFALVADPDLVSSSVDVDGTRISSYHKPQDAVGGQQILEWGAQALAVFTELFGPYPYATLDLVAVPGVTGFEFPQLIFIGADYYPDPGTSGSRPDAIEFLVAHEVAHQWWYGMVGSNQHRHAFLDEGLAEYSAVLYFEYQYGPGAAETQLDAGLRLRYATQLFTAEDQIVDQPTAEFPDADAYYAMVYRKAGLGFAALRAEIGDEAFFAGLEHYAHSMRFRIASPNDLLAVFEEASGRHLDAFWHLWFQTASGRVEIVMEPEPTTPAPATPVASPLAPIEVTPVD